VGTNPIARGTIPHLFNLNSFFLKTGLKTTYFGYIVDIKHIVYPSDPSAVNPLFFAEKGVWTPQKAAKHRRLIV
jgi:hypothetical protein